MKALLFTNGELKVEEIAVPSGAGEALIRVTLSGICNTDLVIVRGYEEFEWTICYAFTVEVERSDDGPELVGKRVVGEINAGCVICEICRVGDPRHYDHRSVLGIVGRYG